MEAKIGNCVWATVFDARPSPTAGIVESDDFVGFPSRLGAPRHRHVDSRSSLSSPIN